MFKLLKDKLKGAVSKFSKEIDEEAENIEESHEEINDIEENLSSDASEEEKAIVKEEDNEGELLKLDEEIPKEKKGFFSRIKEKFEKKEEEKKEVLEIADEEKEEVEPEDIALPEEIKKAEKEDSKKSVVDQIIGDISSKEEDKQGKKETEITKKPETPEKESVTEQPIENVSPKEKTKSMKTPEKKDKTNVDQNIAKVNPKKKTETKKEESIADQLIEDINPEEIKKTESKGFFGKITETITKKRLTEEKFDDLFWDMEIALLENNVAVEVIEKIKNDLKERLVNAKLTRGRIEKEIMDSLSNSISELFDVKSFNLIERAKKKKPFVIAFAGVNGSGKTTTIAKMINLFQKNNLRCIAAAGDTFRAAAIQQLEEHTKKLNVKLIKHDYGADPAAVAYDAIEHAKSKDIDIVLIDTAGRLHSNSNLMDEMKKIIRIAKPDLKLFIGESITGNDCVEQAKKFNEAIEIDGIILSKADIDEKGGAAISVSYVTKKPILFIGTGQEYDDLKKFDKSIIMDTLEVN